MTQAARQAGASADKAAHSDAARVGVTIGLIAFGLIHLTVGWIALQVAWGGASGQQADQQGALQQLASTPLGTPLLWVLGIGLFALVLWQGFAAIRGHTGLEGRKRVVKRISSGARAVVYATLGVAAIRTAVGSGSKGSGSKEEGITAKLLSVPLGRVLVIVVGAVVIGVGVNQIVKGVKEKFLRDLVGDPGTLGRQLGRIGYIAKGVALGIVGGLFLYAALTYDPKKAGGLDDALSTVAAAPVGPYLLTILALGFVAFGIFCFFWARRPKV
ncbi:DUF1206 domain-containing protein [Nakamurella sp. A5-74]|uniref:DUF1206 domain-containing protein n=1 Tax=Nakamurella sp. A5-74 TaxID=3158264 RepID=A0AAU8DLU7_9ACTN